MPCTAIACCHDELAPAEARNSFHFTRNGRVFHHALRIKMGRHVPAPSVFEHRRCMVQTRRIQQVRRLALENNGIFCSEEEDVLPSDIILGGRGAVGAGIMVLGLRRSWHDTRHGGAKRGLLKVKSL